MAKASASTTVGSSTPPTSPHSPLPQSTAAARRPRSSSRRGNQSFPEPTWGSVHRHPPSTVAVHSICHVHTKRRLPFLHRGLLLQHLPYPISPACASSDSVNIIALTNHMPRRLIGTPLQQEHDRESSLPKRRCSNSLHEKSPHMNELHTSHSFQHPFPRPNIPNETHIRAWAICPTEVTALSSCLTSASTSAAVASTADLSRLL